MSHQFLPVQYPSVRIALEFREKREMRQAAKEMKFEHAADLRDKLKYLRERELVVR